MFTWALRKVFGTKHERELKKLQPMVNAVNNLETAMRGLSDEALRGKTAEFKTQLGNGASLNDILVPAFAACREAARRSLGMRHYDVQIVGGIVLDQGKIAEMKTGEGKTLVATLPCYLNALEGKGVHVVTVNDYLARRDAEWMGKVYGFLGLSTGVIVNGQRDSVKKRAYRCDITYGQNNEFGFDYMRDNMKFSIYDYAQRDLNFAIVDEVDSILIDEARTPLIISGPGQTASEKYTKINEIIPRLKRDEHYAVDEKQRQVTLTEAGIDLSQRMVVDRGLTETSNLYDPVNLETLHILQQCLRAHTLYRRDQEYMVSPDGKVLIIDEFTGRTLHGRRWSDGLHQAVEAKERVPIQDENVTLATISFQNLFRLYKKLSGMTGTADTEATEFHKIYKLDVVVIPTNKAVVRQDAEDVVYKTEREKFVEIAKEIEERSKKGQPILVGTTSVEKSDVVAKLLAKRNIPHNVLNAKQHEREAYVVAQAGMPGSVTVATNMAGRGTDIVLGGNSEMLAKMEIADKLASWRQSDEYDPTAPPPFDVEAETASAQKRYKEQCEADKKRVIDAGGLFILGTERHESRRIDNQLRGRGGRQGDPGASRFYLSLEDDLMRIFAGERIQVMMDRLGMKEGEPIEHRWVTKAVENAQKKVEERNFDIRKNLLEYDDVMNQQRKSIYVLRRQILMGQYRTVPTEEEVKKGIQSEPVVSVADPALSERAQPIIDSMLKHHAGGLPPEGSTPEEQAVYRRRAQEARLEDLKTLRTEPLERDVYVWFGCQLELSKFASDPPGARKFLTEAVGLSLTEQKERLLDLIDEITGTMVETACPRAKHYEDWNLQGLAKEFEAQFGIAATGIEKATDSQELARKLYEDADAVLHRKEREFGSETYLRLFRNFYMQEIDRQWIEHLQSMDHLRDGIGLRGYGQRDPKREYKREGFDHFLEMMQSTKSSVTSNMFRVERVTEEDLERQEAQRRRMADARQRGLRANHPGAQAPATGGRAPAGDGRALAAEAPLNRRQRRGAASRAGASAPPAPIPREEVSAQTVRRERPKVGRNDPCWCGSGKKYKQCHLQEDQASASDPDSADAGGRG